MSDFHTLTVSEVKKETPNSVSISFHIPLDLEELFRFKAGQYITIKHDVKGKEVRRAYSICSTPSSGLLKVGIKKVDNGTFSVFANTKLKVNDRLQVMMPEGKFVLRPSTTENHNYIAVVAGSGITPVISIIKSALEEEPSSTFLLVYGNQSRRETMFYSELESLREVYPDRFYIEYLYSRTLEKGGTFGRIDKSKINLFLKNKYKETPFDSFYLCGPEAMINEVSETLKENDIDQENIHYELFTSTEEVSLTEPHDGNTKLSLTVDDETLELTMSQKDTVLEAALDEGIDVPYSCQGGICSTCIARIKEGKAEMRKNQILTDGEIADGLILTCQAQPTTPTLIVDYDDV